MILDDHTAILADIEQSNSDATHIKSILNAASVWSSRLRSEDKAAGALELLVDRVELRQDGIQLSIKLPRLLLVLRSRFKSRARLQAENIILRQQLIS